jgi:hypothetical protein
MSRNRLRQRKRGNGDVSLLFNPPYSCFSYTTGSFRRLFSSSQIFVNTFVDQKEEENVRQEHVTQRDVHFL